MPLTFTPDESEDRRRKMYADAAQGMRGAMGYGFDALSKMESLAKDKAATERQSMLDKEGREKSAAELALKKREAEINENAERRTQAKHDLDMPRLQRLDAEAVEDRGLTLERNALKDARGNLKTIVAAARAQGLSPAQIAAQAHDNPNLAAITGDEEIEAEWRAQADAEAAQERKLALDESGAALDERGMALREQAEKNDTALGWANLKARKDAEKAASAGSGPKTLQEKNRASMRRSAASLLDQVEAGGKAFSENTTLPPGGRVMGNVRDAATGWVPGLNEGDRTKARGAEEAYNAMLFPVLGRTDAPADQETKRLAPLMFRSTDTPEERASKIKLGREMLAASDAADGGGAPAARAVDSDEAALDDYLGGP